MVKKPKNLLCLISLGVVWFLHLSIVPELNPYYYSILMYAGINIILAVSLNLVNGFTGQFSMGHAGFMAVGAYVSAVLTMLAREHYPELASGVLSGGAVFVCSLLLGGLAACVTGYLVGLPSLRLKGDYLAIVTLGFGEIIRVILLNMNYVGGARGIPGVPHLSHFGWIYSFVVVTLFVVTRLVKASQGREFLAVSEDEIAAEAMGVNTTRAKVTAFVVGAFFAGIGGGLFGHFLSYLNPSTFDFNRSFDIIIMVVLGGMGSISGSVVAALALTGLKEALRPLQEITQVDFRMIIYALILILMMLLRPNGLFGRKEIWDFWKRRT